MRLAYSAVELSMVGQSPKMAKKFAMIHQWILEAKKLNVTSAPHPDAGLRFAFLGRTAIEPAAGETTMDDILLRLLRTNDELIKYLNWLFAKDETEAALKLLPIMQTFASLLAEMGEKQIKPGNLALPPRRRR